ncbi:unnamed protein product [Cyprideis torosa]|uniref:Uncharacterized protein n=1 Tax=Cyprideis torosa TaxID=163714 RepID=A0A7R8WTE3_9CRUS|nr:unnamed protein product [Cyprideis torosa]CAG0909944.1 unnamed protein product [Cyprideis torosa]
MADRANSKLATKDKLKQKEIDDPFEERKKPGSEKKPANGYQADEKCGSGGRKQGKKVEEKREPPKNSATGKGNGKAK